MRALGLMDDNQDFNFNFNNPLFGNLISNPHFHLEDLFVRDLSKKRYTFLPSGRARPNEIITIVNNAGTKVFKANNYGQFTLLQPQASSKYLNVRMGDINSRMLEQAVRSARKERFRKLLTQSINHTLIDC